MMSATRSIQEIYSNATNKVNKALEGRRLTGREKKKLRAKTKKRPAAITRLAHRKTYAEYDPTYSDRIHS